jgi:ABC-type nitrate/sulfonate/bicarbonate transport system substrate-binding protein
MSSNYAPPGLRHLLFLMWAVVSALAAGASINSCTRAEKNHTGPPEKITIAYASPPSTALADIALAQGYFRQEGLEVTPIFHSSGKDALEDVLAGKADAATVAELPIMFAVMKGQRISIISTIQTTNNNIVIVARKDQGILTPHDLKGKRIAVPAGTAAEFFLNAFLTAQGISGQEVTTVDLRPDKMGDALMRGEVGAVTTWPPFLGQTQKKLGGKGVTFSDENIYTQFFNIIATPGFVQQNPSCIRKILLALIKAEELITNNPDEAMETVAVFRKVDRALLSGMWKGSTYGVSLDQMLLLALEDESSWAIRNKHTDKTGIPDYLEDIYLDGLRSVKPKAVSIVR